MATESTEEHGKNQAAVIFGGKNTTAVSQELPVFGDT